MTVWNLECGDLLPNSKKDMQTFDRYLLRLFIRVFLICFLSATGLYIVIDSCNNLDEFLRYGQQENGVLGVLTEYYAARIPWFFDYISGFVVLVAAMFAITWLQRTNEMSALMAAGISKSRIVRSLIIASLAIAILAAANRELILPKVREKLTRNAQDWRGETARVLEPLMDNQTSILINGRYTFANEQRISNPAFRLYRRLGNFGRKLEAENAYYQPANEFHPGGFLLVDVEPTQIDGTTTAKLDGRPVIFSPHDTNWLEPNQCFVVSNISFVQLASGSRWRQFASTPELVAGLRNPSLTYGLDAKVAVHSRVVHPLLDMTLFFLGLPLVLASENRNIFVAAGWCLVVVVIFVLVVMACQAMGTSGYLLGPAFAAWLPLLVFAPIAAAVSHPIWE